MLQTIKPFSKAGFALLWLKEAQKRPVNLNWTGEPRSTFDELRRFYTHGLNVGVRLGEPSKIGDLYLHALDVDIRNDKYVPVVHGYLDALLPEWRRLPTVISGSGGASRHIYFLTDSPFASKKLANSGTKVTDAEGKDHYHWEVELFGTGKQVVMPPSIHPCGQPYRWEREFDFDDLDMGLGPYIPEDRVRAWARKKPEAAPDGDPDDLLADVLGGRLDDFTLAEARDVLTVFDAGFWDDRDSWRDAGMALKHQFGDEADAFDLWCELSQLSPKYDVRVQRQQWDSFKRDAKDGITFRSMIAAANAVRSTAEPDGGFDDVEDDDDLIGDIPSSEAADMKLLGGGPDEPEPAKDATPELHWEKLLDRVEGENGKPGAIKPTITNFALIVKNDSRLRGVIGHNEFTHETVQIGMPGRRKAKGVVLPTKQLTQPFWRLHDTENGDMWSEDQDLAVRDLIEAPRLQGGWGLKVSDRDVRGSVRMAGTDNTFHPVKRFIESQQWDGVPRKETLFIDYLGAPDNAYSREVASMMLIAAVARIYEPGHKFDYAVILEGAQGSRKTTFIETLGMGWFCELQGDFHDEKKMVEGMQGAWIMEIPELSQFQKAENEAIKAFISRKADKVRLAYEKRAALFQRQCIFIGSTNNFEYLKDDTGGRRFWPMACNVPLINTGRLRDNMPQIWAEAKVGYDEMRQALPKPFTLPLTLTDPDAIAISKIMQESRRVHGEADIWAARIQDWVDTPRAAGDGFEGGTPAKCDRVCGIEAWVECLGFRIEDYTNRNNQLKMNKALDKLVGFRRHQAAPLGFADYGKQRAWVRNTHF